MKKITNKSLQTALLKGAVLVSGTLCTICAMVFADTFSGLLAVALSGGIVMSILCEHIEQLNK